MNLMNRLALVAAVASFHGTVAREEGRRPWLRNDLIGASEVMLVAAPPRRILDPWSVSRKLFIDDRVRGRDQRHLWLRMLAMVHPRVRLLLVLSLAVVVVTFWLRPGWSAEQCVPAIVISTGTLCRAAIALAFVAAGSTTAALVLAYELYRAEAEEHKDSALSEELLAAAASCAAYEESPSRRALGAPSSAATWRRTPMCRTSGTSSCLVRTRLSPRAWPCPAARARLTWAPRTAAFMA